MSQLVLDVYLPMRIRHGRRPGDSHQRGWFVQPFDTAGGTKAGDVCPAWVCCRCGGVEPSRLWLDRNHGCCDRRVVNRPCDRRERFPGWATALDEHWTPHDPREAR